MRKIIDYLKNRKPKTALMIALLFFVGCMVFLFGGIEMYFVLAPETLFSPLEYYRLIIYSFAIIEIQLWLWHFLVVVICAYIIENYINSRFSTIMTLLGAIIGGLLFLVVSQVTKNQLPAVGPMFITWTFQISTLIITVNRWKQLPSMEKIIGLINLLLLLLNNYGNVEILMPYLLLIPVVLICTLWALKKTNVRNEEYEEIGHL